MNPSIDTLSQRTAELAAANRRLQRGIVRRRKVEAAFRKRGKHDAKLLREARRLQEELRQLTHRALMAQEAERRHISQELRNEIVQTLLGINVRLLTLIKLAESGTASLIKEIASMHLLVQESGQSINRYAHTLDPDQAA